MPMAKRQRSSAGARWANSWLTSSVLLLKAMPESCWKRSTMLSIAAINLCSCAESLLW